MAARTEVTCLAGKREEIIVPAGLAIDPRKAVVQVTALDKTLDCALLHCALKSARVAQFLAVALRALLLGVCPWVAEAIYGTLKRRTAVLRAGLSWRWSAP
jgi:hypothetical protein